MTFERLQEILTAYIDGRVRLTHAAHYELIRRMKGDLVILLGQHPYSESLQASLRSLSRTEHALLLSAEGAEMESRTARAEWDRKAEKLGRFWLKPRTPRPALKLVSDGPADLRLASIALNLTNPCHQGAPMSIAVAQAIATIAHRGQLDKAGEPYIGHPRRVAGLAGWTGGNDLTPQVAWLHDVLEDTDITKEDLQEAGLDSRVIHAVELLTRKPDVDDEVYYARIRANGYARAVKLADIRDNTDPQRLAKLDDKTIVRLTRKYAKALAALN